jgi:hypothetical protein
LGARADRRVPRVSDPGIPGAGCERGRSLAGGAHGSATQVLGWGNDGGLTGGVRGRSGPLVSGRGHAQTRLRGRALTVGALQAMAQNGERSGILTGGSSLSGPPSTLVARTARAPWPELATPHGRRRHEAVAIGRGSRFDGAVLVPAITGDQSMGQRKLGREKRKSGGEIHLGWGGNGGEAGPDGGGARSRTTTEHNQRRVQAQEVWQRGSSDRLEKRMCAARVSGQRRSERGRGKVGVCGDLQRRSGCQFGAGWRRGRGDLGVRARGPRRQAVEGGGGTIEWGPRDSGTDARAHDGPKRRQDGPTEQREGERKRGAGRRREAGSACQRSRARRRGHARVTGLSGPKWLFYFPGIFQLLLYLFSLGFQFKFKSSFKFKLIQTCATIQRIFKLSMMQHFMTHNVLTKINN